MNAVKEKPSRQYKPVQVTIDPDTLTALDEYADENETGRSNVVRRAVRRFLAMDEEFVKPVERTAN